MRTIVAMLLMLMLFCWPLLAARNVANGGSGRIDFGNPSTFNILGDLSVGLWMKLSKTSVYTTTIMTRSEAREAESQQLDWESAGNVRYIHEYSTGSNEMTTFMTTLTTGSWYYIGLSRNFAANTIILYKGDGATLASVSTFNYTNDPTGGTSTGAKLTLLATSTGANQWDGITSRT